MVVVMETKRIAQRVDAIHAEIEKEFKLESERVYFFALLADIEACRRWEKYKSIME